MPMPAPVLPRVVASAYPVCPLPPCVLIALRSSILLREHPLCPCPCPCRCPFASSPFFYSPALGKGAGSPGPLCPCLCQRPYALGWWPLPAVRFFFYFLLKECGGLTIPFALPMPTPVLPRVPSPLPMPMPTPVLPRVVASAYPFCPLPSCFLTALRRGAGLPSRYAHARAKARTLWVGGHPSCPFFFFLAPPVLFFFLL